MAEIDFILPWVDGSDPEWQSRKARVIGGTAEDEREERYRDWDLLRYWFRGVEKFAPWVRRVYFVCDQEPPAWLNRDHPKLRVVRHREYIPAEYLPTFSSHPIELNFHRLPGLSEQFVYFNDDMHLIAPVPENRFFKEGLPRDSALLNPIPTSDLAGKTDARIFHVPLNNTEYLNRNYVFRDCIRKAPGKWLNIRYGTSLLRNLFLMSWPRFVGFYEPHLPQPFLKSSFEKAWKQFGDILHETCTHPIRSDQDVNQWLIRSLQLAEGQFLPIRPIKDAVFDLGQQTAQAAETISSQRIPMVCLNDVPMDRERFLQAKDTLQQAFRKILQNPSSFEIELH